MLLISKPDLFIARISFSLVFKENRFLINSYSKKNLKTHKPNLIQADRRER